MLAWPFALGKFGTLSWQLVKHLVALWQGNLMFFIYSLAPFVFDYFCGAVVYRAQSCQTACGDRDSACRASTPRRDLHCAPRKLRSWQNLRGAAPRGLDTCDPWPRKQTRPLLISQTCRFWVTNWGGNDWRKFFNDTTCQPCLLVMMGGLLALCGSVTVFSKVGFCVPFT